MRAKTQKQLDKINIKYTKIAEWIREECLTGRSIIATTASAGLMYTSDRIDFLEWCLDYGHWDLITEYWEWDKKIAFFQEIS